MSQPALDQRAGTIEAALKAHPLIRDCAVVRETVGGRERLAAYVAPRQEPTAGQKAWTNERVTFNWQQIYDSIYQQPPAGAQAFNTIGWNSAYTGEPFPEAVMHEWLQSVIGRIRARRPRRILELGCGTGMLLFALAPDCETYVGSDFSAVALDYVRQQPRFQALPQVRLLHRGADDFSGIEPQSFDMVVINSVTQHFPSVEYLARVLEQAVAAVAPGGAIFVGDILSLPQLPAFRAGVECARADASATVADLQDLVRQQVLQEHYLWIDPGFFAALRQRQPRIAAVQAELKRGRHHTELTRFRYDVTLHIEAAAADGAGLRWRDWQQAGLSVADVRRTLADEQPEALGLRGLPNARLATETALLKTLAGGDHPATVGELRELVASQAVAGIDPEDVYDLAETLGYAAELRWSEQDPGRFDVLLRRAPAGDLPPLAPPTDQPPAAAWQDYATIPLRGLQTRTLAPMLKQYLKTQLPDGAAPATWAVLEEIPRTAAGAIDLAALPADDGQASRRPGERLRALQR